MNYNFPKTFYSFNFIKLVLLGWFIRDKKINMFSLTSSGT